MKVDRNYRIAWKSKITSYKGHGETIYTEKECTERCNKLNEEWPDVLHYPEHVES